MYVANKHLQEKFSYVLVRWTVTFEVTERGWKLAYFWNVAKTNIRYNFCVINNPSFNVKLRKRNGSLTGNRNAQLALDCQILLWPAMCDWRILDNWRTLLIWTRKTKWTFFQNLKIALPFYFKFKLIKCKIELISKNKLWYKCKNKR